MRRSFNQMTSVLLRNALACLRLAVFGVTPTLFAANACAAGPVELQRTIATLESCEGKIESAQWKAHLSVVELANPNDITSIVKTRPEKIEAAVVWDRKRKRIRVDYQSVLQWQDGTAPYFSDRQGICFDGALYRSWRIGKAGTEIPKENDDFAEGVVRNDRAEITQLEMRSWGMEYMPPFFDDRSVGHDPQPLSQLLRHAKADGISITIVEDDAAIWTIAINDEKRYHDTMEIRIDPTKGCKLLGIKCLSTKEHVVWCELQIASREVSPGIWAPDQWSWVYLLDKPCVASIWKYSDVAINVKLPENAFEFNFPAGTRVDDRVSNTRYKIGAVENDEAKSADAADSKSASLEVNFDMSRGCAALQGRHGTSATAVRR